MDTPMDSRTPTIVAMESSVTKMKEEEVVKHEESPAPFVQHTRDFGIIPIPKHLRYHPDKPFHFGLGLNIAFGFASTFSA